MPVRIAVIAEHDPIWCLAIWERTIPRLLAAGHDLRGLVTCPPKFGKIPPDEVGGWYAATFGQDDARHLEQYCEVATRSRASRALHGQCVASFQELANVCQIGLHFANGPNDASFQTWLKRERVDVLVINIGHIVGRETLQLPRLGTLNLHDSLLPANKGILPYLHAVVSGTLNGITVHDVVPQIDAGAIRAQVRLSLDVVLSMIGFQHEVIRRYPDLMSIAIDNLARGKNLTPPVDVPESYFGLPTPADVSAFRAAGGRILNSMDLRDVETL